MSGSRPSLSRRRIVLWIVGMTVTPLSILLFLGWRFLETDRVLADKQAQDRIEQAADRVVLDLQRAVTSSMQRLASDEKDWPPGAVAVTFREGFVSAYPRNRVAWLPVVPALKEAPADVFSAGDSAEFRRADRAGAIRIFEELSHSSDPAVRTGALLRLGPNLEKTGREQEALAIYARLTDVDDIGIAGVPAGIAALYLRCELLRREKRDAELRAAAQRLAAGLEASRWLLTESAYRSYTRYAAKWIEANPYESEGESELYADAIDGLWKQWRASKLAEGSAALNVRGEALTTISQSEGGAYRTLIVRPDFVKAQWLPQAEARAAELKIAFTLGEGTGDDSPTVRRRTAETALPWDVSAIALDPSMDLRGFQYRQRLLAAGFALLAALAFIAGYMIFRAIGRELAASQLQSDFVAAVSHEFRTPLTTLRQFTTMLREQPNLEEQRRQLAYGAQARATDRLVALVESVLDFGRMEAGAYRYQFNQYDCAEIVRRAVEEFQGAAQAADHEIALQREGSVVITADAEALSRAIRNLLENAVKYSPGQRHIEVSVRCQEREARIAVRDHGIGVPAHESAKIFSKFQRGDEARRRGIRGTGVGLAMVDEIVKAHHGRVIVESEPGAGSTFTIVLPIKE
jgi:signal transduction histidine kinase